jgi:hypothetical protein
VSDHDELREAIARQRGLPAAAASFLRGQTTSELDESADRPADLFDERSEPEPAASPFDPAERVRRKQDLAAIFLGRPQQPGDEQGRYTRAAVIHRGAREPVLPKRSPEVAHNETLISLLKTRGADSGIYFGGF